MKTNHNLFAKWNLFRENVRQVLGMNRRNLHYIYPNNQRCDYPLADNKLLTKVCLEEAGLPIVKSYRTYRYFYELRTLVDDLSSYTSFVIKPAGGRGGGGIKVISAKKGTAWEDVNGAVVTIDDIKKQLLDIIFGIYSFDTHDVAIVEEKVIQHTVIDAIFDKGLSDVRVVMCKHNPIMAMLRVPTQFSSGRANLHQGAVGVGVDIETGVTQNAILNGDLISHHPDTGKILAGVQIPDWEKLLQVCDEIARLMPLKYLGVDIAISQKGPVIFEVNVRPGIEIQNANQMGLRAMLEVFKDIER